MCQIHSELNIELYLPTVQIRFLSLLIEPLLLDGIIFFLTHQKRKDGIKVIIDTSKYSLTNQLVRQTDPLTSQRSIRLYVCVC